MKTLAIDLGTSGPKVGVFNVRGEYLRTAFRPVPLLMHDGGVEQDPADWWAAVRMAVADVLGTLSAAERAAIHVISVTGQWSGTVAVDESGSPLRRAIIWMDTRGKRPLARSCRGLLNVKGYSAYKLAWWLRKTGGAPGMSGKDSIAHICYIRDRHPDVFENTYKFLEPKDYINYLLTGEFASSHDSMALHWVTDNRVAQDIVYDPKLLSFFAIDADRLPSLASSTTTLAPLKGDLATEWGLPHKPPVIVGSPDIHTAAVGSGAVKDFSPHLYIGTSSWMTCHVPFKATSLRYHMATLPSAIPGRYFVANEQESAGICLDRLRSSWLAGREPLSYQDLEHLAENAEPGSRGVVFTPWLNGERTPVEDASLRGGFHNISLQSSGSDLVRSVFEGVALNSKWLLVALESFLKRRLDRLNFIGGGANSDVWCQVHADVLQRKIQQVAHPQASNLRGAAWLGFMALGELEIEEVEKLVRISRIYEPRSRLEPLYRERFQSFLALYRAQKQHRPISASSH